MDVGAIGRWIYEACDAAAAVDIWKHLVDATSRSPRRFVWVAALPGDLPDGFASADLYKAITTLGAFGIGTIISSEEPVTSLVSNDSTVAIYEPTTVVTASVNEDAYPEQLYVLEGGVQSILDIATGAAHTYWTQFRDVLGEPNFVPVIQAAIRSNTADAKKRPLGGKRAYKFKEQLDRMLQDIPMADGSPPSVYLEVLGKWWHNLEEIELRAKAIVGNVIDSAARAALQHRLPARRPPVTSPGVPPIVVVPFATGVNGKIERGRASPRAVIGSSTQSCFANELSTAGFLSDLVKVHPKLWIAPRALDLLGFMADHDIPLPERVVDPAHCAFALDPDNIDAAVSSCPTASTLPGDASGWLWDVKRKEPPPAELDQISAALGGIVAQLRAQTKSRGIDALIDDDIAATVPVLAAMERRGAWVASRVERIQARRSLQSEMDQLEVRMGGLEANHGPFLGNLDPYKALPNYLVQAAAHRGIVLPGSHIHAGSGAKSTLERLGALDERIAALLEARTLADISKWLERVDNSGERMRGHYVPLASGRWGMNAWHMQGIPKHSAQAKHVRALLCAPPGKRLLGADFSSFELRLIAGLSGDPRLLAAAQAPDAIGYLAEGFFGVTSDPGERAERRAAMKSNIHPLNYGTEEWGFIDSQVSLSVDEARRRYEALHNSFEHLFRWRAGVAVSGHVRTAGGWQRTPPATLKRSRENKTVSTTVQGLAADILRWCLRELNKTLPSMKAELIFQNHDEIYVAVDEDSVTTVRAELLDVFERRVARNSGLVPTGIKLVARVREGVTWADVT